jgi:hypothetical protein
MKSELTRRMTKSAASSSALMLASISPPGRDPVVAPDVYKTLSTKQRKVLVKFSTILLVCVAVRDEGAGHYLFLACRQT